MKEILERGALEKANEHINVLNASLLVAEMKTANISDRLNEVELLLEGKTKEVSILSEKHTLERLESINKIAERCSHYLTDEEKQYLRNKAQESWRTYRQRFKEKAKTLYIEHGASSLKIASLIHEQLAQKGEINKGALEVIEKLYNPSQQLLEDAEEIAREKLKAENIKEELQGRLKINLEKLDRFPEIYRQIKSGAEENIEPPKPFTPN